AHTRTEDGPRGATPERWRCRDKKPAARRSEGATRQTSFDRSTTVAKDFAAPSPHFQSPGEAHDLILRHVTVRRWIARGPPGVGPVVACSMFGQRDSRSRQMPNLI